MKQKKAIIDLWKLGYFTNFVSCNQVEKKLLKDFGITSSNMLMILKNCKFLRKTKEGWIQKYPAERNEDIQVYYFEPGKPRSSRMDFVKILNSLSGNIDICDPYLNKDTLEALEEIKKAQVRFLTADKKENIKVSEQNLKDFKKENDNIEIRSFFSDYLHDRYIITNDRLFLLGHGFSIRNKESFVVELPKKFSKDLIQSLKTTFDIRWGNKDNKKLI